MHTAEAIIISSATILAMTAVAHTAMVLPAVRYHAAALTIPLPTAMASVLHTSLAGVARRDSVVTPQSHTVITLNITAIHHPYAAVAVEAQAVHTPAAVAVVDSLAVAVAILAEVQAAIRAEASVAEDDNYELLMGKPQNTTRT